MNTDRRTTCAALELCGDLPRRRVCGLRRTASVAPRLVISTLVVLIVAPTLPDWAGVCLFYGGVSAALILVLGLGESRATRALFNARRLTQSERVGLGGVVAELCQLELGAPTVDLYVSRRYGAPAAIAHGRRSVVMAPEFVDGIRTGQLPQREALAVLAHAGLVSRSGLVKQDPAIFFWSTPWRVLTALARPARGLLGFAWKIRIVVFGVAIWQNATENSTRAEPLSAPMIAAALATILALTYLVPRWTTGWERYVAATGDSELASRNLGPAMAAFLRRYPQTPAVIERIQLLDPPARQKPSLRLVRI